MVQGESHQRIILQGLRPRDARTNDTAFRIARHTVPYGSICILAAAVYLYGRVRSWRGEGEVRRRSLRVRRTPRHSVERRLAARRLVCFRAAELFGIFCTLTKLYTTMYGFT